MIFRNNNSNKNYNILDNKEITPFRVKAKKIKLVKIEETEINNKTNVTIKDYALVVEVLTVEEFV